MTSTETLQTPLIPNPLYGWDPAKHQIAARLLRGENGKSVGGGAYRVYEVLDHGMVVGLVVSRDRSHRTKTREWDYTDTSDWRECRVYGFNSRHDAVAALLEKRERS
jgi:hypothetical protein